MASAPAVPLHRLIINLVSHYTLSLVDSDYSRRVENSLSVDCQSSVVT